MPLAKISDRILASTQVCFPAHRRQRQVYLTSKTIDNWALEITLRVWLRGFPTGESGHMCDYSMHNVRTRPAKVGDELTTRHFGTSTRGFAASEDPSLAVCLLPGTELAFAADVACEPTSLLFWRKKVIKHKTAIFRQINKNTPTTHHDALEFPDGQIRLLTILRVGQRATVLQLPVELRAAIKTEEPQKAIYAD
jgi:hypothetical protein